MKQFSSPAAAEQQYLALVSANTMPPTATSVQQLVSPALTTTSPQTTNASLSLAANATVHQLSLPPTMTTA